MAGWWRMVLAALAVLVMTTAPAKGQAQTQPTEPAPQARSTFYNQKDATTRAPRDKSPSRTARETAAADSAAALCETRDQAGCAALGRAFLRGEGRPQSRPLAVVLLSEACTAGIGAGCLTLGDFYGRLTYEASRREAAALLQRGCDLGTLDACARLAELVEEGVPSTDSPDPVAAATLRRAACDAGGAAACSAIFVKALAAATSPAEEDAALDGLDQLCREGAAPACDVLVGRFIRPGEPLDTPYLVGLADDACRAGGAAACTARGRLAFAAAEGPPETRAVALALFDRACDLAREECDVPRAIRAVAVLVPACANGEQPACAALGERYSENWSPLYDAAAALRLLGTACEAGETDACGSAVVTMIAASPPPLGEVDAGRVIRWSGIACDAGDANECAILGDRLLDGGIVPRDTEAGLALLGKACDTGDDKTCDRLAKLVLDNPAAPLPAADARIAPPMDEAEVQALKDALSARMAAEKARAEAGRCTSTSVVWRGVTYEDQICAAQVRGLGYLPVKIGVAPWQALIWRPTKLGPLMLTPADQVECGGAVISTGWILTAAHCLVDHIDEVGNFRLETSGYRIRLGVHNPLADEGISYPILRTIAHPAFKRPSLAYDIGLIQYDPKAGRPAATVHPIARIKLDDKPLAQRKIAPLDPAYTFGWGWTAFEGASKPPNALRGAVLQLRDAETCAKITKLTGDRRMSVLCAVGERGEQACFGDSGGPLITYGDPGKKPTVIGVVSAGIKCGTTDVPSRFTRLGHPLVQAWLASHLPGFRSGQTGR